jgi:5-hydroxyisourate hydrolase-like protein (transthyretin family)
MITVPLKCSNELPDDNGYATVTIELLPNAFSGYDGVKITVTADESVLIPTETDLMTQNFGIQKFGFNYNGDPTSLEITTYEDDAVTVENQWKVKYSQNVSEFGVFAELLQGTGKHRHNPFIMTVCKTGTDLTEADFNTGNALDNNFVAHIADFYYNEEYYETDSAYFADCRYCFDTSDCDDGYTCFSGDCIEEAPPALGAGPFVAAGSWPTLPTSQESPIYLDQNYSVLWTFSDDYASCPDGVCTHVAEYQKAGDSEWTALTTVNTDSTGKKYAYVELPVESLQNATTYAFRFTVTDCAGQTTQSGTYYFRVATSDAPPAITGGPVLYAEGGWWPLPTSASKAGVLCQNYPVLWTFSDDYASCAGLCKHRARYRKLGDTVWTWITPVSTDSTGKKYAYTELPVAGLAAGTYQFHFDVRDCAGQIGYAPKTYYFKVE